MVFTIARTAAASFYSMKPMCIWWRIPVSLSRF